MTYLSRYAISPKCILLSCVWLGFMGCVLLSESSASVGGMPRIPFLDKIGHFGLFFGQFWLIGKAIVLLPNRLFWTVSLTVAVLLAVATELAQGYLTATRLLEFWDGVADIIGTVVALIFVKQANS